MNSFDDISLNYGKSKILIKRGGVLEDVFGLKDVLEDTFSSPWPWPQTVQALENALFSARRQHWL